jgi:periplasmic protein TonB
VALVVSLLLHCVVGLVPLAGASGTPPRADEVPVVTLLPEPIFPPRPALSQPEPVVATDVPEPEPPVTEAPAPEPAPPMEQQPQKKKKADARPKVVAPKPSVHASKEGTPHAQYTTLAIQGVVPQRPSPQAMESPVASMRKSPKSELDAYKSSVFAAILAQPRTYPKIARRLGLEGVVAINFTILEDGGVSAVAISSKGPHPSLDEEASRIVQASAPFPPPPPGAEAPLCFTVAISFNLDKG